MGGISSALVNSANTLGVLGEAFDVVSNNISNANTPEYANQTLNFEPLPFDLSEQLPGGVTSGGVISSRDEYLEQAVRTQQSALSSATQTAGDLGQVQTLFSLTSSSGIDTALNTFFDSFSQLSVSPNDTTTRQAVLTAASGVAEAIESTASGIGQVSSNISGQTQSVVTQINDIASQIAQLNQSYESNSSSSSQDAGLDAQMHEDLENLSQLTDFSIVRDNSGAYNILLGGQTPVVLGGNSYAISAGSTSGQSTIYDSQGNDITSEISQGQLGAMLQEQNTTLPSYMSSLNTLAQSFADAVNGQLSQGVDENGNSPTTPLFSYQEGQAALTITTNNLTPDQIAAASAGAPGGNGNAVALAQLANAQDAAGQTFTQDYGTLSAQIGNDVSAAQQDQQQAQGQLTQAQAQVSAVSGVDLNAEATQVLQYQQAYDAVGKLVSVLQDLTTTLINAVQATVA